MHNSNLFTFLTTVFIPGFLFLIKATLMDKKWYFIVVLIFISLMISFADYLYVLIGHLYIFFGKSLFKSFAQFWIELFRVFFVVKLEEFFICSGY